MAQIVCPTLSYNKYSRTFGNIGYSRLTPARNGKGTDKLLGRGDIARHGKQGIGCAHLQHLLHEFYVALWSLNKNLRLMLHMRPSLKAL